MPKGYHRQTRKATYLPKKERPAFRDPYVYPDLYYWPDIDTVPAGERARRLKPRRSSGQKRTKRRSGARKFSGGAVVQARSLTKQCFPSKDAKVQVPAKYLDPKRAAPPLPANKSCCRGKAVRHKGETWRSKAYTREGRKVYRWVRLG